MPDEQQLRIGRLDRGQVGGDVIGWVLQLQEVEADQAAHRRFCKHLRSTITLRTRTLRSTPSGGRLALQNGTERIQAAHWVKSPRAASLSRAA
jgi:hypothetical protein